ncbi:MAG: tetratricopeptide repeat protein [Pseudomonadales bacterium]|nr:tetratricopeptide repeat protein [Pseudomonadales bacterium]
MRPKIKFFLTLLITSILLVACGSEEETPDISALLKNAEDYRASGQFKAAIIETKNAIRMSPQDISGHTGLAIIFNDIGQPKEAIKILEDLNLDAMESEPNYILTLATAYLKANKTRSAERLLNTHMDKLAPQPTKLKLLQGDLALANKDFTEAELKYNEVLSLDSNNVDAKLSLASIAAFQQKTEQVKQLLDAALQTDPDNIKALLFYSSLKTKQGDMPAAEELLITAMTNLERSDILTPLRYSVLLALKDNLTRQGKVNEAMIYSAMLSESLPGVEEINSTLKDAMQALTKNNLEDAREYLEEVQQKVPGSEQAGTMLGVLEYLQGNNSAAVAQFEKFIDPETATTTTLQMFAMAELKLNHPEKVVARLKTEIDSSEDAKLTSLYGIALVSSGDLETGEKYLLRSVTLDQQDGRLHLPLVRFYNTQNKLKSGLSHAQQAFENQPDDPLIQATYVEQLLAMKETDKASKVMKGIQSGFPESAGAQLLAARYQLTMGNLEEALALFDKSLALEESPLARKLHASVNLQLKQYDAAAADYAKVISLDTEDKEAYKGLITAYELKNEATKGIDLVIQYLAKSNAMAPRLILSEYYGRNNQFIKAFELLAPLERPLQPAQLELNTSLHLAKANIEMRTGDLTLSRKTIDQALLGAPQDARIFSVLISLELLSDNIKAAQAVYEKLNQLVPGTRLAAMLAGDIAKAREDYPSAYKNYLFAWEAKSTDRMGLQVFTAQNLAKMSADKRRGFLDQWQKKLPNSKLAKLTEAGFLMENGDRDTARKKYEAILALSDNIAVAHNNLAWIYGENELDKALAAGKKAYELAPENAEIIDTYAWFLFKNGDLEQAKALLTKAYTLAPDNKEIREHFELVSNQS